KASGENTSASRTGGIARPLNPPVGTGRAGAPAPPFPGRGAAGGMSNSAPRSRSRSNAPRGWRRGIPPRAGGGVVAGYAWARLGRGGDAGGRCRSARGGCAGADVVRGGPPPGDSRSGDSRPGGAAAGGPPPAAPARGGWGRGSSCSVSASFSVNESGSTGWSTGDAVVIDTGGGAGSSSGGSSASTGEGPPSVTSSGGRSSG